MLLLHCSLTWALVHSHKKTDVSRGLELIDALLTSDGTERRELLYLRAVGQFRLKHHLDARKTLKAIMVEYPDFRQAESLLESCEEQIVIDGIVGVGAGAAIIGIVAGMAIALLKK